MEQGVYDNMPAAEYHAAERMSYSGSRKILRSPMHYRLSRDKPSEPTDAMLYGSAVHTGVLEPHLFESSVVAAPVCDGRTKEGKQIKADFILASAGKLVLSADAYDRARRSIDAVLGHSLAMSLLSGTHKEQSFFWTDSTHNVPCKARMDARSDGIIDLKTTKDASPEEFLRSVITFQYHVQAGAYFSACEHVLNEIPAYFVDIAVESEEPYGVACYEIPNEAILAGTHLWNRALARYAEALTGGWHGYPETVQTLTFPKWALTFDV